MTVVLTSEWSNSFPVPQSINWGAAGLTIMAAKTKKLLALKRASFWEETRSGGTWCNAGGSRDYEIDRTPLDTAIRETREEITNFDPSMMIAQPELAFIYKGRSGRNPNPFFNYVAVVEDEFMPTLDTKENTEARWLHEKDWPLPLHFGMRAFFADHYAQNVLATKRICPRAKTFSNKTDCSLKAASLCPAA